MIPIQLFRHYNRLEKVHVIQQGGRCNGERYVTTLNVVEHISEFKEIYRRQQKALIACMAEEQMISVQEIEELTNNGIKITFNCIIEIKGQEKPACVAEFLAMAYTK